jgi:hypothetical protein
MLAVVSDSSPLVYLTRLNRFEAKLKGLIPEVRSELNRLKETTNFRFTEDLLAIAMQKAGEQPHRA